MSVSGSDTERGYLHGAILFFAGRVQHFPDFFVPAINQERRCGTLERLPVSQLQVDDRF